MNDTQDRAETKKDNDRKGLPRGHWYEEKMIPDSKTGRLYGPYLYERWRDGPICKSRYHGKVNK